MRGAVAVVVAHRPGGNGPSDVLTPLLGVPAVLRAVRALLASGSVDRVVLLVDLEAEATARQLVDGLPVSVHTDPHEAARCAQTSAAPIVLHDSARPLASPALAVAVTDAVAAGHAVAVPVLPLSDTVKRVDVEGVVVGTPDRGNLRVLQTPQAFRAGVLCTTVLAKVLASTEPLEQAWAIAGEPAVTVPGHPLAFAVRSAWERELAEVLGREHA
jgi:2-C-methyl-D-erythritol 4-phosphate cytidylyltransferase